MKFESEDFSTQDLIFKWLVGKTGLARCNCGQGEQQLERQLKSSPSALGNCSVLLYRTSDSSEPAGLGYNNILLYYRAFFS